jgi:hypothetical protein
VLSFAPAVFCHELRQTIRLPAITLKIMTNINAGRAGMGLEDG